MKHQVIQKISLAVLMLLSLNCGARVEKQKFVDDYTSVLSEFMSRDKVIKKGQEAVIAYRRSNLNDIDNAEIAKDNFLQSIRIDSAAMVHLRSLKSPGSSENEIIYLLNSGIESVSQGTTILASNYSKAKDQNIDERKITIMNVRPALVYLAKGFNAVVISINNVEDFIKKNDLKESEQLRRCSEYFQKERDNLSSFLKD